MSDELRLDRWGALAGLALGITDTAVLLALGVHWNVGGRDATLLVGSWFSFSFTFLGWLAGRLAMARQRARRDAETIRSQAEALEATRKEASENEKLAACLQLDDLVLGALNQKHVARFESHIAKTGLQGYGVLARPVERQGDQLIAICGVLSIPPTAHLAPGTGPGDDFDPPTP